MPRHVRWLATLLSAAWPGLGQAYRGRRRSAAIFAIPYTAAAVVLTWLIVEDPEAALFALLDPAVARSLAVVLVVAGLWRAAGVLDAGLRGGRGRLGGLVVVGIALSISAVHLGGASYLASLASSSEQLFAGPVAVAGPDAAEDPPGDSTSLTPGPNAEPSETPAPPPQASGDRLTVLFVGFDSGPGRNHALTDTMVVFSLDRATGTTTAISVPRDVAGMTLYDGSRYAGKINELASYADARPGRFPAGGLEVLRAQLSHLVGIPIDHYAAVNLPGFERVIDLVGGVRVNNPRAIDDPSLPWGTGRRGFRLAAGPVTLNGEQALAFVRSRKGAGDNDFTRARRQQPLLVALRDRLTRPSMVPEMPRIIAAASDLVRTDVAASELRDLFAFGRSAGDSELTSIVLGPPYSFHRPTSETGGLWTLTLDLRKVAQLSRELFGDESRYAE